MGKYSLENHQKFDSLVIRSGWYPKPPHNPGHGLEEDFDPGLPLIPLRQPEALLQARNQGAAFALLLTPDESGWLDTAQALAEHGLQRHWETAPVYARLSEAPGPEQVEQLQAWHVRAANFPANLDMDLRLRRLTCPCALSSQGALPLRLWMQNAGASPLYGPHRLFLRLSRGAWSEDLPLQTPPDVFMKLGDIVYNEILQLPALPEGELALRLILTGPGGSPLLLNTDLPEQEGLYQVGTILADHKPRPQLFTIWEDWYPDGYYPLEDPKVPLTEE